MIFGLLTSFARIRTSLLARIASSGVIRLILAIGIHTEMQIMKNEINAATMIACGEV